MKNTIKPEKCPYFHKLCQKDCKNYVCRAFFPEKQPYVMTRDEEICRSSEHLECLQYIDGKRWHEERLAKWASMYCPFASNTICSKPWDWWCKGGYVPFELTIPVYEEDGTGRKWLKRDEEGNIIFERSLEDIKDTCLTGDPEIYTNCPNYITGMKVREEWRQRKAQRKGQKEAQKQV